MRPELPTPPPMFGVPVPVPIPARGQDARLLAAVTRAGLINANHRLVNDKSFQEDVWARFSKTVSGK